MKLSIIVPVYNEINTIAEILRQTKEADFEKEIIVVDDGSRDGTREFLENYKDSLVKKIFHSKNQGKGACIRDALEEVSGDIVIIQDADLEYHPDEYTKLVRLITQNKADVVYGSRFIGEHRCFLFTHLIGNKLVNLIANILYNTTLTDVTGGQKVFKAGIFNDIEIKSNRFGFEAEITAKIFKRRLRVYEVPICYSGRTYKEGKKIKWYDFFPMVYWLIRTRFID
ncbi:MAG: glycosyltransferase family 2 protein [Candidatus Omnitrophica bacterium]|nr:glycosyltransferase family 2 protein [Candidatus Omnitrophota bacterium]